MAHVRPFSQLCATILGGVIVAAAPVNASAAQLQPINHSEFTSQLPTMLHPVADSAPGGGPGGFADLAEKVEAAVIGVASKATTTRKTLPGQSFEFGTPDQEGPKDDAPRLDHSDPRQAPTTAETVAIGSGFFISADGYAVTNSHVVEDNDAAKIRTSDNKTYAARIVRKDRLSDLALIKVDGRTDFSFVKIADQPPRVGDWILAAGNPFGLGGTMTAGIVSAREREIERGPAEGLLQIDAPISSGDSGGPSFNTRGEVVGVNSMILSLSGGWSGVAFAVPADTVKSVIPQLKEKGSVTRGSIAAEVQSVTPDIADGLGMNNLHGAIVAGVQTNGPAAKAGLRRGDVITSVGGEPIKNANELTKKIHTMPPGSSVQLGMLRDRQQSSSSVTLGELSNEDSNASAASPNGAFCKQCSAGGGHCMPGPGGANACVFQ
jgi:serine protease Do